MPRPPTSLLLFAPGTTKGLLTMFLLLLTTSPVMHAVQQQHHNQILQFRDTNYSSPTITNVTYISSKSYDAKGMAPLYKIANQILGLFIGDNVIPEGKNRYLLIVVFFWIKQRQNSKNG